MLKKALSVFVAAVLLLAAIPMVASAADMAEYNYSEIKNVYEGYTPIPLLVIVMSFDADGDGKDAYLEGKSTTDSSSAAYKEQWAHSEESYWAQSLFGDEGNTMKNYFKLMSNGNFWWEPAEETYGEANNGIVYVTLNMQHPGVSGSGTPATIGSSRIPAINEAAKYVDFAKYDKNGDGTITWDELTFLYICAGRSTKFTSSPVGNSIWGVHSFKSDGTSWSTKINGVTLCKTKYTAVGEMQNDGKPLSFGSIAHELGHVLGADDLYTLKGYQWNGGPGNLALQGGGSGIGQNKGARAGTAPAAIDPYYLIDYGFEKATVVQDGTYTLYSRESTKGDYNIIRINTANPNEYYLIENRYTVDPSTYDAIDPSARGILIWHIDETVMKSGVPVGYKEGSPRNPGIEDLNPSGSLAWGSEAGTYFDCHNYKFLESQTWYTLLTEEEADNFDLKIEFLSEKGNEMQIKVSGTIDVPVRFKTVASTTTDTISLSGKVTELNCGTLNMITATVSKNADGSNPIATGYIKPDEAGSFSYDFTGLDEKSTYYVTITAKGSKGESTTSIKAYTKAPPKVRTDDYSVYLYKGMTTVNRPYEVTVKCGQPLTYSFPMTKTLEKFGGWYYDTECTDQYDMSFTKTDCEPMYLYARWIRNEEAVTLKIVGAKSKYMMFAVKVGESFAEPVLEDNDGKELVGWYLDPQYTQEFDFSDPTSEAGEITVYARWEGDEPQPIETTTETTKTTETTATTTSAEETTTPSESTSTTGGSGNSCKSVIGAGTSLAVVCVIGTALALGRKKKEQ